LIDFSKKKRISEKEGLSTELKFKKLIISKGRKCDDASEEQNIYDHIDFFIDGVPVDVKGNRYLDCIWLEVTNVNGKSGWLKGKSEYIVFDIKELFAFCFFKTKDLLDYCLKINQRTTNKKDFNKIYTRSDFGRKDEIIKVRYKHINHLIKSILKYENSSS
jgi:hypothetical protein